MTKGFIYIVSINDTKLKIVGSTLDYIRRKKQYLKELRRNRYKNIYLQRAFNKYGEENFIFNIVQRGIPINILQFVEDIWIGTKCSRIEDKKGGMNMRDAFRNRFSNKTKNKISRSQITRIGKPVVVLDLNCKYITTCKSTTEASKKFKIKAECIGKICKNQSTCKRYIFIYKNEYDLNTDYSYKIYNASLYIKNSYKPGLEIGRLKKRKKTTLIINNQLVIFESRTEAAKAIGKSIAYVCKLANKQEKIKFL